MTVRVVTFDDNVASAVVPATGIPTITEIQFENNGVRVGDQNTVKINFNDNITAALDPLDATTVIINAEAGGGTGGGHVIENAAGDDLAQRANLQFVGATVSDDAANDRTIVEVTQGERIVIGEDQFKVETASGMTFDPPRTEAGEPGEAVEFFDDPSNENLTTVFDEYGVVQRAGTLAATLVKWSDGSSVDISSTSNATDGIFIDGSTVYYARFNTVGANTQLQILSRTIGETTETVHYTNADTTFAERIFAISVIGSNIYFYLTATTGSGLYQVETSTTRTLIASNSGNSLAMNTNGTLLFIAIGTSIFEINPTDITPTFTSRIVDYTGSGGISILNNILYYFSSATTLQTVAKQYNISTMATVDFNNYPSNIMFNSGETGERISTSDNGWGIIGTNVFMPTQDRTIKRWSTLRNYTQTLALPNVTINTDTDKYVYASTSSSIQTRTSSYNTNSANLELGDFITFGTFVSEDFSSTIGFPTADLSFTDLNDITEIIIGTTVFNIYAFNTTVFNNIPTTRFFATISTAGDFVPGTTANDTSFIIMFNPIEAGTLEIIDEEHYDMNFSLNITNSASYTGTDYELFLDIDGLNSGTIVNELVSGTTTYNVTVPASIHRGNDIRIREFVPDATTINAITTSWSAGSSWAVDEAAISGLQTSKVTLDPSAVTAGAASVTHNLNNRYLTVWVVYNGRTASSRQQVINSFTIASNDTIDVIGLATDADIASYTFLIQGF